MRYFQFKAVSGTDKPTEKPKFTTATPKTVEKKNETTVKKKSSTSEQH